MNKFFQYCQKEGRMSSTIYFQENGFAVIGLNFILKVKRYRFILF